MKHRASLFVRSLLAAAALGGAPVAIAQQKPLHSPLVVQVARSKTDSGRRTNFDSGYSSSKDYNRTVSLKSTIRNMSTNAIAMKQETFFVAEALSAGSADGIYSRNERSENIPARGLLENSVESEPLTGHEYKSSFGSNYKYGSKFKGYIVRTFANGQLVDVQASQPSLEKIGWDDKALKRMLPREPEPAPARRND